MESLVFGMFLTGLLAGALLGIFLENRRWRRNADDYRRIESGGRLYKVSLEK